jgi:hypothetical protein
LPNWPDEWPALIDAGGRVHWKRTGGEPFADVVFLLQSVKRMNQKAALAVGAAGSNQ